MDKYILIRLFLFLAAVVLAFLFIVQSIRSQQPIGIIGSLQEQEISYDPEKLYWELKKHDR